MSAGTIDVGPDKFPVAIQGAGPPLLFVHGAPGDWRTFAPHAAMLASSYRTITFTQRWFGTAAWREDGPAFGTVEHSADLIALAEALDLGKLTLVSWSYGAHVALKAALDRPDLFAAHIAYEPGYGTYIEDSFDRARYKKDADATWEPVFAAQREGGDIVRAIHDACAGDGSFDALSPEQQQLKRDSKTALERLLKQTPPAALTQDAMQEMNLPTAVGYGRDTRPSFAISAQTAAEVMVSERFTIEQAGHMWPQDRPDGFAKLVDFWAGKLNPAG